MVTPVSGMRVLNQAATAYTKIRTAMAASGGGVDAGVNQRKIK